MKDAEITFSHSFFKNPLGRYDVVSKVYYTHLVPMYRIPDHHRPFLQFGQLLSHVNLWSFPIFSDKQSQEKLPTISPTDLYAAAAAFSIRRLFRWFSIRENRLSTARSILTVLHLYPTTPPPSASVLLGTKKRKKKRKGKNTVKKIRR